MAAAEERPRRRASSRSRALRKRFGANEVLKGIDLEVGAAR